MAYLTKIGSEKYRVTKDGRPVFASRAYWIFRRGKRVMKRFGGISVVGSRRNRYVLKNGWHEDERAYGKESEAKEAVADFVAKKLKNGWMLLPPGEKIPSPVG